MTIRLSRKQLVLIKAESAPGTDPTPTAADNAIKARLAVPTMEMQNIVSKNVIATLSPQPGRIGSITGKLDLEFDLTTNGSADVAVGDSTNPIRLEPVFKAMGLKPTYTAETSGGAADGYVTFAPYATGDPISSTIYFNKDGQQHEINYGYCNGEFTFNAGETASIKASYSGTSATAPADTALATATYDEVTPAIVESMTMTITPLAGAAYTGIIQTATINLNNEITIIKDLNSPLGVYGARITGRKPSFNCTFLAPLESEFPMWAAVRAGTVCAVSFVYKSSVMGKFTFTLPAIQIENVPHGDNSGMLTYDLTSVCTGTADNEISIKLEKYS